MSTPEVSFRNHRGERVAAVAFTATEAKNEFGRVLETVLKGRPAVITKRDAPKAVLLSMEEFNALAGPAASTLNTLRDEWDALFARMQTPKARTGMRTAFRASPRQLGKAAVAAARKRT